MNNWLWPMVNQSVFCSPTTILFIYYISKIKKHVIIIPFTHVGLELHVSPSSQVICSSPCKTYVSLQLINATSPKVDPVGRLATPFAGVGSPQS